MDYEQIYLDEIHRHRIMVDTRKADFGAPYYSGKNRNGAAFELITLSKEDRDAVNHPVLLSPIREARYFGDEDDDGWRLDPEENEYFFNEDEYAVISDCEYINDDIIGGEQTVAEFTLLSIATENGALTGSSECSKQNHETRGEIGRNHIEKMALRETANGRLKHASKTIPVKYSKETDNVIINGHIGGADSSGEESRCSDEEFPYEITSTPKKDYEMKILAGPSDLIEVKKMPKMKSIAASEEVTDKKEGLSGAELRRLSSRFRKSIDDLAVQYKQTKRKRLKSNSMEELRNLGNGQLNDGDESDGIKMHVLSGGSLIKSAFDLRSSSTDTLIPRENGSTQPQPPPVSEIIQLKNFDIEMTDIDHTKTSEIRAESVVGNAQDGECENDESGHLCYDGKDISSTGVADESFFEIEIRSGEYEHGEADSTPSEFEMRTILRESDSDDKLVFFSSTDFILARSQMEILIDSAFTSRFLSIFHRELHKLKKFINVLYIDVNKPTEVTHEVLEPSKNVEIIEEINILHIYTFVHEKIIYLEDDIIDDDWFIIS